MPSLTACRRRLLERVGGGGVYTTDGAGSSSTLVCAAAFKNSSLPSDHLAFAWAHVPSVTAPKQRQVTAAGLANGTGTITVNDVYGGTPGSGVVFELSKLAPLVDGGAKTLGPSLNQFVNLGNDMLLIEDEITVAITTSDEISLATWQWLDRPDRLRAVLEPAPTSGRAAIDASWRFRPNEPLLCLDGELPKLRLAVPFTSATGNLTLKVLRPAGTWLRISSTWTETAYGTGMTAEADETKADIDDVVSSALVFFYQSKAQSARGPDRGRWQGLYEEALAAARKLRYWDSTRDKLTPAPTEDVPVREIAMGAFGQRRAA